MNRKAIIYISSGVIVLLCLVALFFFLRKPERIARPKLEDIEKKTIVFKDVRYAGERKGVIDWEIEAAQAKKYLNKPVVEMESVKGLYKPKEGVVVSFKGAKSFLDTEKEQGKIESVEVLYNNEYMLKSAYMNFDFKKGVTYTKAPLEIKGPKLTIVGKGLTAYTKEGIMRIERDVGGSIDTAKGKLHFQSGSLTYRMKENVYVLDGGVRMKGDDMSLLCSTLHIYGQKDGFEKMVAKGKVRIQTKRITARGESAVYYFKEGQIVSGGTQNLYNEGKIVSRIKKGAKE